ncbi:MAG: S-layer homology domain-containing protein, partial [Sphaerospermopsis sp. SIO1G2]|nr:S-layer homology domain-containing protein [Sphaerospermopsis sp. SIO1G2]
KNVEQAVAPDPSLQSNPAIFAETNTQITSSTSSVSLPDNFPENIPKYPNAKLIEIQASTNTDNRPEKQIFTRWQSYDPSNVIADFYRSQLQNNNWQIFQQPQNQTEGIFEAKNEQLLLKVSINPKSINNSSNQTQNFTELLITYTQNNIDKNKLENRDIASTSDQNNNHQFIGPKLPDSQITSAQDNPINNNQIRLENPEFNDLNQVPPEWRRQIRDLAKLGVLSVAQTANNSNSSPQSQSFEPDKIITRREYTRWLVATNNAMYANNPAKKIRLASANTQPAFRDVLPSDPDFPTIQGLAEAGLISSSLSGDATAVLFRPDAPLTREHLLMWKVPLDTRQALPNSSLEAVKQTWGFQDTEKIDPKALRAILADFQNAEKSNIRRVFGYTTLFQPKKAVTRAEAGAALSYFGLQSEGMSTTEALKLQVE